MKKIIALLLAVLMVAGLFTGCAQKPVDAPAANDAPAADAPVVAEDATITMAFYSSHEYDGSEWIFQKIKEYTGVTVKPIAYTTEVYGEKLSTFLAGNLPDVMHSYSMVVSEINTYGDQGAYVNILDHLDEVPSYKAIFVDDPINYERLLNNGSQATGAVYACPTYRLARDVNHGTMYRADIFEDLGLELWTDTEGFYQTLKALKEAYPDSYPLTGKDWTGSVFRWAAGYGINMLDTAYDYESGQWYIGAADERYHELLNYMQKMYAEGLLDPDFFTNDTDTMQAKIINGESFIFSDWIGRMGILEPQGQQFDPDFNLVYGPNLGTGKINAADPFAGGGLLVANNDNAAASLKVIEFLYSDKGREIMTIGEEGENFEWDENGNPVYAEIDADPVTIAELEETYGMWVGDMFLYPDRRSVYYNYTEDEQYAQDFMNEKGYFDPVPPKVIADEDATTYSDLFTAFNTDFMEFTTLYVTNSAYGQAEWEAWVAKCDATYGPMIDILNK